MVLLVAALLFSPILLAEEEQPAKVDCPACPAGCVPADLVHEYALDPYKYENDCPAGCVDIRMVRSLSFEPACQMAPLRLKPGFTEEENKPLVYSARRYSHTLNRMVTSRTALPLTDSKFSATGYMIGLWELNGSPYKNLQVGILTLIPAGFFAFVPTAHYSGEIAENSYLGAGLFGGYFSDYLGWLELEVWTMGGSLEYTYVYKDKHVFNVMLLAMGGGHDKGNDGIENWPFAILLPSLAYQYRWSESWAFNLDMSVPLLIDDHADETQKDIEEKFTYNIFYGVRGHGGIIFGDIGFYLPASKWFKNYLWKYFPFGFPYFSIGVEI